MSVVRVVPNLATTSLEAAKAFYVSVLGFEVVMDTGWIVTLADPQRPHLQLSLITQDATAPVVAAVSIEVPDVDAAYAAAEASGAEIVHPLTDEPWGVRRFFMRDPDGHVVNVLSHPPVPVTESRRLQLVRACFAAYETGDRGALERLIATPFVFSAPPDVGIDRDTYFERCWPNAQNIRAFELVRLAEVGEEVIATYEATRYDGRRFRNTEIFGFAGSQISRVEVYFGWDLED